MSTPVLQLKNASIFQRESLILSDISLSINKGEFVYLIGKTGSGKSSFMKTLYGDLPLQQGEGTIVDFDLVSPGGGEDGLHGGIIFVGLGGVVLE